MNRLVCVGDGFAHGHIWPEWPQMLSALASDRETITISGVGAGNEFLINGLLHQRPYEDVVVFQWADPDRFDKIIQDDQWRTLGLQDDTYHFNFYQQGPHTWWLSSASINSHVRQYHDFYVQSQQSAQRMEDYKTLLKGYLSSRKNYYIEISTQGQEVFSRQTRFAHLRGHEVQPSPAIHLAYIEEIILPALPFAVDVARLDRLRASINDCQWTAYDPDRNQTWQDIINNLDTA